MSDSPDVAALAKLARLEVSAAELAQLEEEIPHIVRFVESVREAAAGVEHKNEGLRNVMRDDANPHESGIYSESLLKAAPAREGNRILVKQVIRRK